MMAVAFEKEEVWSAQDFGLKAVVVDLFSVVTECMRGSGQPDAK